LRPRFGRIFIERLAASESRLGGSGNPPLRKTLPFSFAPFI
jgi:hypothetical protein